MRTGAPRVTVLMPVRDAGGSLVAAVESIRRQTFDDWELVVVDDGSTDGSGERLESLARVDDRIRVLRREHGGIVAALNAGLAESRGEWVARMDADDLSHPDRLWEQTRELGADPELGLVGCAVAFGGDEMASAGYAAHVSWLNSVVTEEEIGRSRFVESPFAHPSVMFRRGLVSRYGGYRAGDFPEDYELWLRWLEAGVRMRKVPRVLLTWNDQPARLSRTDPRYAPEAFFALKSEYLARWLASRSMGDRPIWVWGAGRVTRRRVDLLRALGVRIQTHVDIDARKWGRHRDGRVVKSPAAIPPTGGVFILGYVAKRGARESQRAFLSGLGYREGEDFLFVA